MKKNNALVIAFILILTSIHPSANAAQYQSPESLQKAIQNYINEHFKTYKEYTLKIGKFDNRLQLPLCENKLNVFTRTSLIKLGRNSVGISCQNTKKKWTIFSSATINAFKKVITLTEPVRRGEILSLSILQLERRDISSLRAGFITNPKLIAGKQATKHLPLGAIINKSNITAAKLIKRGEKVSIKVSSENLQISVSGLALMDGTKNQNIKVRNLTSKKIIHATVIKKGLVEVSL